jgi:uroporphyrinogen-III synthase
MSLLNTTILITRQRAQSADLIAGIERRGGIPLIFPMICIQDPGSWEKADTALRQISLYDGIVLTSVNGVGRFFGRVNTLGIAIPDKCAVFAVGEKTAEEIRRHGMHVEAIPKSYSATGLVELFRERGIGGKRFLYPRGNKGREELIDGMTGLGATVDAVEVYSNVPASGSGDQELWRKVNSGGIDVVLFASPSAASHFFELVPESAHPALRSKITIAAIGPTTAAAIRELGFPVDIIASTSTTEGLLDAIEIYCENR